MLWFILSSFLLLVPSIERVKFILHEISNRKLGPILEAKDQDLDIIYKVHDKNYVKFLETAWDEWIKEGFKGEAIPTVWPSRSMNSKIIPNNIEGKLGYYCLANETSISQGTIEGAYESVKIVLTAAEMLQNEKSIFALCRPPGHHASKDQYGGYCFFNNIAIAAEKLIEEGAKKILFLILIFTMEMGLRKFFISVQMFILHLCMGIQWKHSLIFLDMLMKKELKKEKVLILIALYLEILHMPNGENLLLM